MDNKFILVAYVGQGQNWGQNGPQKHSKFGYLKFKPQYHWPDKYNRPTGGAPNPACHIVSSENFFFSRSKLNPSKKKWPPPPKNGRFFVFFWGGGGLRVFVFVYGRGFLQCLYSFPLCPIRDYPLQKKNQSFNKKKGVENHDKCFLSYLQ